MSADCIILAGGLGTRLRSVVQEVPKCLAPLGDRTFLDYLLFSLQQKGITHFIFAVGYQREKIRQHLASFHPGLEYSWSEEEEPLGTGGAIRRACGYAFTDHVWIMNGDTYFDVNLRAMMAFHRLNDSLCTLALKQMKQFDRYGSVHVNEEYRITGFEEKKWKDEGLINGGVYLLQRLPFLDMDWPPVFSFEKDFLEAKLQESTFAGYIQDAYFIDIGIPEDYRKAQQEIPPPVLMNTPSFLQHINPNWTLFLDRDGVINEEKKDDYIRRPEEFRFMPGAVEAIRLFTDRFARILVVTNQKGIGKGWMTEQDLLDIHTYMVAGIEASGGRIDKIYYSPHLSDEHPERKPNPGMGYKAQHDFPPIQFEQSIMIGNTLSDMQFGKSLGMFTIFLSTTRPVPELPHAWIDAVFPDLLSVAKAL